MWTLDRPTIAQQLEQVAHQIGHPREPVTIADLQAACRVGEAATEMLAATSGGQARPVAEDAQRAWREARRTLVSFTDAAPGSAPIAAAAIRACRQIEAARRTGEIREPDLRLIRQQLPRLASAIERELRDLRTAPLIRPGVTPLRAAHITAWRDRRTVVADRADIDVVGDLVRRARDSSDTLTQVPERGMGDIQPACDSSRGPRTLMVVNGKRNLTSFRRQGSNALRLWTTPMDGTELRR